MWWGTILSSSADRYPAGIIFLYRGVCNNIKRWNMSVIRRALLIHPIRLPSQLTVGYTTHCLYVHVNDCCYVLNLPSSTAAGKSSLSLQPTPVSVSSYFFGVQFLSSHCALKMSATTTTTLLGCPPPSISGGWTWLIRVAKKLKKPTEITVGCCVQIIDIFPHPRGMIRMTEHFFKFFNRWKIFPTVLGCGDCPLKSSFFFPLYLIRWLGGREKQKSPNKITCVKKWICLRRKINNFFQCGHLTMKFCFSFFKFFPFNVCVWERLVMVKQTLHTGAGRIEKNSWLLRRSHLFFTHHHSSSAQVLTSL